VHPAVLDDEKQVALVILQHVGVLEGAPSTTNISVQALS
jgi:hypothetical protein